MLDRLIKGEDMTSRYTAWSAYRGELTQYIMESIHDNLIKKKLISIRERRLKESYDLDTAIKEFVIDNKRKPSLAIWGAGGCNDIDIRSLSRYFTIILVDRDVEVLERARERENLSTEECRCVDIKFFDLTYDSYAMLEAMLKDNCEDCEITDYIKEVAAESENSNIEALPKFDYSVAVGLSSQLTARLCALLAEYERLLPLENVIKNITEAAVNSMMEAVIKLTKELVVWGYEIYSADKIKDLPIQAVEDYHYMLDEYEEYESNILGNQYLVKKMLQYVDGEARFRIVKRKAMVWPFTEVKQYLMHIVAVEIIK